jgi:hypothetical protein
LDLILWVICGEDIGGELEVEREKGFVMVKGGDFFVVGNI